MTLEQLINEILTVKGERGDQIDALCPFHKDTRASFTINKRTGDWKCFKPDCEGYKGGKLKTLLIKLDVKDPEKKAREVLREAGDVLDIRKVEKLHANLLENKAVINYLTKNCGYTKDTIARFKLGWDGVRIHIPIFDEHKNLVNIRKYNPINEAKTVGIVGCNKPRIFPIENIQNDDTKIFLCAGEKDTILANQLGFNAITITAGEGVIPRDNLHLFKNKIVYIIHDVDDAGEIAVKKIVATLRDVVRKIIKVTLPVTYPNKDITDFIIKERKDKESILDAIERGRVLFERSQIEQEKPIKTTVENALIPKHYNKNISFEATIIGKDFDPYLVPKTIEIYCIGSGTSKTCNTCPLKENSKIVNFGLKDYIRFVGVSEKNLQTAISDLAKLPRCKNVEIINKEMSSLYALHFESVINNDTRENPQSKTDSSQGYAVDVDFVMNQTYECVGYVMSDPKTQYGTILIHKMTKLNSNIDIFVLTKEEVEKFKLIFHT